MKSIKSILILAIGMMALLNVGCSNESGQNKKVQTELNKDGDTPPKTVFEDIQSLVELNIKDGTIETSTSKINCIKITNNNGVTNATGCATYKGVKYSFSYWGQTTSDNGAVQPAYIHLMENSDCHC